TQVAISLHNDYCDRELDAQAKPWRALPRRLVAPSTAWRWAVVLLALGLLAALPLGVPVLALTAIGTAAGFVYNAYLKRTAWSWLPFWIGLPTLVLAAFAAMDRFDARLWSAYLIGAPLVVSIHLADTLADIESDTTLGLRGLAHRLGPWRARLTCWGALALAQALVLAAALRIVLSSEMLGLSSGGLVDLLVVACLLYLIFKIPLLAANAVKSGSGSRTWSQTKTMLVNTGKAVTAA
ncbi:MAG: hypothetical protein GEU73_17605, partial [Chloroflexi bacterium]|nr:hypothetical protein [Chloroflexota bacterium]